MSNIFGKNVVIIDVARYYELLDCERWLTAYSECGATDTYHDEAQMIYEELKNQEGEV
jgi:hypothetical protein